MKPDWRGYREIPTYRDPGYLKWEFRRAAQRVIRWVDNNIFVCAVWLCLLTSALTILALRVVSK